jgi:hypothetical protein
MWAVIMKRRLHELVTSWSVITKQTNKNRISPCSKFILFVHVYCWMEICQQ